MGCFTWHGRFVWIFVFQCLGSGHLVHGCGMVSCPMVDGADFIHFYRMGLRGIYFLGGIKPVADEMGVDFPHIKKTAYDFGRYGIHKYVKIPVAGLISQFFRLAACSFKDFDNLLIRVMGRLSGAWAVIKEA